MESQKELNSIQIKKEHLMDNKNWSLIKNAPHGIFVYTKIEDEEGSRNETKFCEDGTYVYYKYVR